MTGEEGATGEEKVFSGRDRLEVRLCGVTGFESGDGAFTGEEGGGLDDGIMAGEDAAIGCRCERGVAK